MNKDKLLNDMRNWRIAWAWLYRNDPELAGQAMKNREITRFVNGRRK